MKTALALIVLFSQQAFAVEYKDELRAIMMVETSGGVNLNHRMITRGLHAGTKAAGRFGIMPITGKEFVERRNVQELSYLAELDHDEFVAYLNKHEEVDKKLARKIWRHLRKTRGAEEAACAWYRGFYAERCKDEYQLARDPYVQQFVQYLRGPANDNAEESQ